MKSHKTWTFSTSNFKKIIYCRERNRVETEKLEEQYQSQLDEEIQSIRSELVEKIDGYLNYVVEQWMEENELAIETGLRAEIAESFIDSLKQVFVEHYVEVPEGKADLVDGLSPMAKALITCRRLLRARSLRAPLVAAAIIFLGVRWS